jgi:beta-galactosidase/beta-glucuronidase
MNRLVIIGIILLGMNLQAQKYAPVQGKIMTKWAEEVSPENVWQEYPRPQLVRDSWMNLNGLWDYSLLKKNVAKPSKYQGKILVPFPIESALSGVAKSMMPDDRLWYKRSFKVPSDWNSKRVILNFEAVDWSSTVWVNGAVVGAHKGAFDRFSFDITDYLRSSGNQEIIVAVDDPTSEGSQARGKQRLEQSGIWYTPASGIWQTVWLEAVNKEASIGEIKITPDIDRNLVTVMPMTGDPLEPGYTASISVFDGNNLVAEASVKADKSVEISLENPKLWSPDSPFLYDMKLVLSNADGKVLDEIDTYFGMRKISLGPAIFNQVLYLNNKPLFHYGTLDQGWWPDGLHTPPSDEAMRYDIEMTKNMGFNMIRKHIKVEPDRWFYHCDKLGIMVWQDMPSGMVVQMAEEGGRPRSIQGIRPFADDLNRRSESSSQWEWELKRMIDIHYNAPSIVIWVPFNEGWGQYATCRIAEMVKDLDPSRLVNAASGWGIRPCGDFLDLHNYSTDLYTPPLSRNEATVWGEYGGIGYPVEGHQWNTEMRNWGYQTYHSGEELLEAYKYKFNQIADMRTRGLSGAVYTQTTDVEGEVNGLMTYDRKIIKIPADTLMKIHSVLYEEMDPDPRRR